ncbi:MAG: hypothetical protein ACW990_17195 [Promethearchaeota archaeon]
MKIIVKEYESKMDEGLLNLFYKSNFHNRKEFDYVRIPKKWIFRYDLNKPYITKIALDGGEVIGSLGIVTRTSKINNEFIKIGCFVDNCVLPEYYDHYDEIFGELFKELEKDAKEEDLDIILGWTFLKHVHKHQKFWKDQGFIHKEGINCYLGGSDFDCSYPYPQKPDISLRWKILLGMYKYFYRIRARFLDPLPKKIILRMMKKSDLKNIHLFLTKESQDFEFSSFYTLDEFEEIVKNSNIHGIIAEKNSEIIGVLTFINTAWSGWMYGIPNYEKNWSIFYSFIVDEFVMKSEYQSTSVPANMILKLMRIKDPEKGIQNNNYTYVGGIFDREIGWERKAFLKLGFNEPKFDYGAILAKPLKEGLNFNLNKNWLLPTRYILAPVPSREDLKKLGYLS